MGLRMHAVTSIGGAQMCQARSRQKHAGTVYVINGCEYFLTIEGVSQFDLFAKPKSIQHRCKSRVCCDCLARKSVDGSRAKDAPGCGPRRGRRDESATSAVEHLDKPQCH